MEQQEKKLAPPYMSWKTFVGFLEGFNQGLPPRLDKSAMSRLNGINQNLMMNTLTYLHLITADSKPEPLLEQIVNSFGPENQVEHKRYLDTMLRGAYPFLFDRTEDFDLERSTSAHFDSKFTSQGVSGDTIQKCEAFFTAAAKEAGIKISSLILASKRKGPKRVSLGSPRVKIGNTGKREEELFRPPVENPPFQELPKWYTTFKPAFDKLPPFDNPHWTLDDRSRWIAALSSLLDLYISLDKEEGKEN